MDAILIGQLISGSVVGGLFIYSNAKPILKNKIRLQKLSEYNECIISNHTFVDPKTTQQRKREFINKQLDDLTSPLQLVSEYTSEDNLKAMYRNLSSIKLMPIMQVGSLAGYYDVIRNKINIIPSAISIVQNEMNVVPKCKHVLIHEFLHMASSYYDEINEIAYSGLSQHKGDISIGNGIDEGYTQLLTLRMHSKDSPVSYELEVKIATLLEFFFDDPKMLEKYYFNHDLPGLIHHLEKFAPRKEVIKFIMSVDSMHFLSANKYVANYYSIKAQLTLYNWFKVKNKNPEAHARFREILRESKFMELLISGSKIKLDKNSPNQDFNNESITRKM